MELAGLGIMVDDMAVMVRFYRDILGFEIKEDENTTPYDGAKPTLLVTEIEDKDFMKKLILAMYEEFPDTKKGVSKR